MVILESSDSAEKKTVNIAESIDKITDLLQEAKCIIGDDFTQIAKLKSVRGLIVVRLHRIERSLSLSQNLIYFINTSYSDIFSFV